MTKTMTREALIQELADLPEMGLYEVLDFVRFLKSQWQSMSPEERFDRAWMTARRIAAEQGITDQDIVNEIEAVRREAQYPVVGASEILGGIGGTV